MRSTTGIRFFGGIPLLAVTALLISHPSATQADGLGIVDSLVAIQFADDVYSTAPHDFAVARPELRDDHEPWSLGRGFFVFGIEESHDAGTAMDSIRCTDAVRIVNPVLGSEHGNMWMTDHLVVRFLPSATAAEIDALHAELARHVDTPDPRYPLEHWVSMRAGAAATVLDVARRYQQSGLCVYAQPNFISRPIPCGLPSDPFVGMQWQYISTSQPPAANVCADSAWLITTGDSAVSVAVIDFGFDWSSNPSVHDHEDGPPSTRVFGWDVAGENFWNPPEFDFDPRGDCQDQPYVCAHGSAVLGMLAAQHDNELGLAGLAPHCRYWAIKAFDDNNAMSTDSLRAVAFRGAASVADILCNAWHMFPSDTFRFHIDSTLADIRADGNMVFFASGNEGGILPPPTDNPNVFAVGAVNKANRVFSWSGKGDNLAFVAPSSVITTSPPCPSIYADIWTWDHMGVEGYITKCFDASACYDKTNYIGKGGGTSLAVPQAAGVAALIFSKRADFLDSVDPAGVVFDIMKESAVDTVSDTLNTPGWDSCYGYGMLNAFHALLAVSRGEINSDGVWDVRDVVLVVEEAFRGQPFQGCHPGLADLNCDSVVNILDVVQTVNLAFRNGDHPAPCYRYDY